MNRVWWRGDSQFRDMVLKGNKMFRSSLRRACDDLWSVVQDQEVAMLNFDGNFSVLLICLPEFTVQTDAERFQEAFENGLLGLRFRGWITRRRILMRSEYSSRCFDTPNSSTNRRSLSSLGSSWLSLVLILVYRNGRRLLIGPIETKCKPRRYRWAVA